MSEFQPHVIVIDGAPNSGKKTLCFELAVLLLYNNLKTAVFLKPQSLLRQTLTSRRQNYPTLPHPQIIDNNNFDTLKNNFDVIIIPEITATDELALNANTYITLIPQNRKNINNFSKDTPYINAIWELKKKIASLHKRSLNWIVCENNTTSTTLVPHAALLEKNAKTYGFRLSPPLANRPAYQTNISGISAQDKTNAELKKQMNYGDICAKREIIKLAEFIFAT